MQNKGAAVLFLIFTLGNAMAFGQGTAFTYSGRLKDHTNPANGIYDLKFGLFSASTDGASLATPVTNSAVTVSNGFFSVPVDFGANQFDGAERWLEIGIRTNGGSSFTNLFSRQKITPSPYAIAASQLTGQLPTTQLSGTIPASLVSGEFSNVVTFGNSGNVFAGSFSGNGAALTNVQSTNVANNMYVINVLDFGAKGDGVTDDTLAISNAQVAQVERRLPLYFPGRPTGKYYRISGPLRAYDGINDVRAVNIAGSDTASRIEIIADTGASIVQTSDNPVFVFTNGLNWIHIRGINLVNALGAGDSTASGIAFYSVGVNGGQNTDHVLIQNSEVKGFKYGLFSESGCIMSLQELALNFNFHPFVLTSTNAVGTVATWNNSVYFHSCSFVQNFQGGIVRGGVGIVFDGCEVGGPLQTNMITLDTTSAASLQFRGGNVELYHGAAVNVVGPNPGFAVIRFENFGMRNFGNALLLINTNLTSCPQVTIDQGGYVIRDDSWLHSFSVQKGSVMIIESNRFGIWRTNYAGIASSQEISELGVNYNGPAPNPRYEGTLITKYNYDHKGRTMLSYGAVSNWGGGGQRVFNYPLLQYNYDLADGKIPPVGITTNINVISGNYILQLQFTRGVLTGVVPQ